MSAERGSRYLPATAPNATAITPSSGASRAEARDASATATGASAAPSDSPSTPTRALVSAGAPPMISAPIASHASQASPAANARRAGPDPASAS
jgi:hypothetical protein